MENLGKCFHAKIWSTRFGHKPGIYILLMIGGRYEEIWYIVHLLGNVINVRTVLNIFRISLNNQSSNPYRF